MFSYDLYASPRHCRVTELHELGLAIRVVELWWQGLEYFEILPFDTFLVLIRCGFFRRCCSCGYASESREVVDVHTVEDVKVYTVDHSNTLEQKRHSDVTDLQLPVMIWNFERATTTTQSCLY